MRKYLIVLALLLSILGCNQPCPCPCPVPTPTPTSDIRTHLHGVVGEVLSYEFIEDAPMQASDSVVATETPVGVRLFEIKQYESQMPSYAGAPKGLLDDPLFPVKSTSLGIRYWADLWLNQVGDYEIPGLPVTVHVKPGPMKLSLPFYAELQFAQIASAHNLADEGSTYLARCDLAFQYAAVLRTHGVEPIKQYVYAFPPVGEWTAPQGSPSLCGFNAMVIDPAIYPPMLIRSGPAPSQEVLESIQAKTLPIDAWAYAWDEGEGEADVQAAARATFIKTYAPKLKVMVTRRPSTSFPADWFFPVMNFYPYSMPVAGAYISCMSNGNCANMISESSVAPAKAYPMATIDAPRIHMRVFPWMLEKEGIPRGLYFNTTQRLPTAMQPNGQYNEGGQGDGTLLYANLGVSMRLKQLRRGLQDIWYLRQGKAFASPITSPTVWSKNESDYEAIRKAIWEKL